MPLICDHGVISHRVTWDNLLAYLSKFVWVDFVGLSQGAERNVDNINIKLYLNSLQRNAMRRNEADTQKMAIAVQFADMIGSTSFFHCLHFHSDDGLIFTS